MIPASDVIGSASLLLTALAVLLALWHEEIRTAVQVSVPRHLQDARAARQQVGGALRERVWPLTGATVLFLLAFTPVAVGELIISFQNVRREGLAALADYDPNSVALLMVLAVAAVILRFLVGYHRSLKKLLKKMDPEAV